MLFWNQWEIYPSIMLSATVALPQCSLYHCGYSTMLSVSLWLFHNAQWITVAGHCHGDHHGQLLSWWKSNLCIFRFFWNLFCFIFVSCQAGCIWWSCLLLGGVRWGLKEGDMLFEQLGTTCEWRVRTFAKNSSGKNSLAACWLWVSSSGTGKLSDDICLCLTNAWSCLSLDQLFWAHVVTLGYNDPAYGDSSPITTQFCW